MNKLCSIVHNSRDEGTGAKHMVFVIIENCHTSIKKALGISIVSVTHKNNS